MQATPCSVVTSAITVAAADSSSMPLRACTTTGCQVNKFVEVTKRKCYQFVSAPYIIPKPLVVNGKTSIFQMGGDMAKMGDIPALSATTGGSGQGQPIYRIKPGTHAHVINYVFIEESSDSLDKPKMEDQEAMRIMLDSHRESASSKLKKLIAIHRGSASQPPAPTTATATSVPVTTTPLTTTSTIRIATSHTHPSLSIASVAGASPTAAAITTTATSTLTPPPVAQTQTTPALSTTVATSTTPAVAAAPAPAQAPVPVAKPAPVLVAKPAPVPAAKPAPVPAAKPAPVPAAKPADNDKLRIEKLKAEIFELRRQCELLNSGKH